MNEKSKQAVADQKKPIGMVDVARRAGVSPATVSRVINGNPTVDPKIRDHVWETIKELKYRPHHAARNLPRGQTGYLAVATPRTSRILFGNPFFSRIFEGIGEALDESHFNMLISTTTPQFKRLLDAHTVDGILLCAVRKGDPYLEELEILDLPVVVIGAYGANSNFTTFGPDYVGGTTAAVEYLAKLGHKRIGLFNGPATSFKSEAGQRGFSEAVSRLGLIETGSMSAEEFIEHEGYTLFMERKKSGKEIPTAYVASSDYLAIGILKAAIDLGMKIPDDLSVVGFGDIPFAALYNPPLTTIHGDLMEMGFEAAQTLISMVSGGSRTPRRVTYPMRLVERGTAAAPPK